MTIIPGFTGSPLDRCDAIRGDDAAVAALAARDDALLFDLDGYEPRLDPQGALSWVPVGELAPGELLFLGQIDGVPRFAHLPASPEPARRSAGLFAILESLPAGEAGTYAAARSLIDWHSRHRFCAHCGTPTAPCKAGWARVCPSCGTEHFPRTDPVVIMLAQHGQGEAARVLVGRQAVFPPGRYSALAGFVEVGESLEEAVRRELFEEAGVRAGRVRYLCSQPWPFPSQLMIACIAETESDALMLDGNEIEDAKWVTRAGVRAALAGEEGALFLPPPPYAIANTLFRMWMGA
jgi:NAD+ diphosphatase